MTTLTTPRLRLRTPARTDVDEVYHACQDPDIQRFTLVPVPFRRADAEAFVERAAQPGAQTFVIRRAVDEAFVGVVGMRPTPDGVGSLGYWCVPQMRGRGYLREAVDASVTHALTGPPDGLGLQRIEWRALVDNPSSARLAAAVGFRYTGRRSEEVRHAAAEMHTAQLSSEAFAAGDRFPVGWPPEALHPGR